MKAKSARTSAALATAALLVLALLSALSWGGAAAVAAPPWTDASDSWWQSVYKVSEAQVAQVADGFADGTFRPGVSVTRGQFAKMTVNGLAIPALEPDVPTFIDVPAGSTFYPFIEGACSQGLINGFNTASGKYYRPSTTISRQQTNSILGRYLSELELKATGVIHGLAGKSYGSLQEWYLWEGAFYVEGFLDYNEIASDHLAATAFLVFHEVVKGSDGYLRPRATLSRAQAAALIIRVREVATALTTPPAPPVLERTVPGDLSNGNWCADPTPLIEGRATPFSEVYVYLAGSSTTWIAAGYADSTGHVSLRVQVPLPEGMHEIVARTRSPEGLYSSASAALFYGVDLTPPRVRITRPVDEGVYYTDSPYPPFFAEVTDVDSGSGGNGSGVARVDFMYCPLNGDGLPSSWADFVLLSTSFSEPYEAAYPLGGLPEGRYFFGVRAYDRAGNVSLLLDGGVYVAGVTQEVVIDKDLGGDSSNDQEEP